MPIRLICAVLILLSPFSCQRQTLEPIEPPPRPPISHADQDAATGSAKSPSALQPVPAAYSGPMASTEAQAVLADLKERKFTDEDGVFGGGEWTVASFSVSPYHDGGLWKRGPHITLTQGARSFDLPIEADGDVADFYRRVTGQAHPSLGSGMSEAYKRAVRRADG